jgi:drug/metabolite transporter (DMT)-like permease
VRSRWLIFTPLYSCPALLIREVTRRRGLGPPSTLATAFGLVLVLTAGALGVRRARRSVAV